MKNQRCNDEGMALLLATVFVAIAILTLGAMMVGVVSERRQVEFFENYEDCMYGIESAIAMSTASLEAGTGGLIGVASGSGFNPLADDPFEESGVTPLTIATMPGLEYFAFAVDWRSDGTDNNGDGSIDEFQEWWYFTIYAYARQMSTVRRVEVVVQGQDVNVWRNAIFAGSGQSGGLVNGNVSIHGSVHLLGDNVLPGGEVLTALDISGTSLIHNNYVGLEKKPELLARVPPLPTTTFNGETIGTLEAVLRVRHGLVGLSGTSEIGEPDVAGNTIKETMDGTYVTDGWTGTSTIDDGGRGIPTEVYSDNGYNETYDLGDRVPMPILQDYWRDPVTGARQWDSSRNEWYTHENYFREVLVGDPVNPTDGLINGNVVIDAKTSNYYYNASRPADLNPANRQATDDYILFDCATNRMELNGQLYINGNLTLTGQGGDKTIYYTGRGAILVNGDATLDTHLMTLNADGTVALSYPVTNCFGIMTSGDMTVGSTSQLDMMGGFYAQGIVTSAKQTTTMGTFVGNFFNMGGQVPDIYQVPALADNLPFGMIGNYPIMAFGIESWRELGI
ncbi:MAG TPA: hypothetical protein VMZ06_12785 [Candidatus Bathyarchaeia archaeon]|nr:hypothetical protein [Candidatus Bathyarchaeia archaeon]